MEQKLPLPPFNTESAIQKIRMAEDAWNTRDPEKVSLVYTEDTFGEIELNFRKAEIKYRSFSSVNGPRSLTID